VWDAATNKCACKSGFVAKVLACLNSTDYSLVAGTYSPDTSDGVNYRDVETGTSSTLGTDKNSPSDVFTTLLPLAIYECLKYQTPKQCQTLANLCTLTMYDPNSAACKALRALQTNSTSVNSFYSIGWSEKLPWLYYSNNSVSILQSSGRFTAKMSLATTTPQSGTTNLLVFKMAKYDINGNFISFDDLTIQLMLCSQSLQDGVDFRRFGMTIENSCKLDLTTLIGNNLPDTANKFFELFIVDVNGNYVDVPIKI
jgi:hypothetical protein